MQGRALRSRFTPDESIFYAKTVVCMADLNLLEEKGALHGLTGALAEMDFLIITWVKL